MSPFSVTERKNPAPSRREIEISKVIKEALEPALILDQFPRTAVDVFIEILQADGGSRCAALDAASVALADAGIPMRDMVCACAAGKVADTIVLDVNNEEDQAGQADAPQRWAAAVHGCNAARQGPVHCAGSQHAAAAREIRQPAPAGRHAADGRLCRDDARV